MKTRLFSRLSLILALALSLQGTLPTAAAGGPVPDRVGAQAPSTVYLPLISKPAPPPAYTCPTTSSNSYSAGIAYQQDADNPVRPADLHADKNLALRGYALAPDGTPKTFVNLGSDDPTQPPQFATLFNPNRVPTFSNVYRANTWNWAPSPTPGTPGGPITDWPVTVLGLQTAAGDLLYVPGSGYDIGGGMEVIVMFADADSITFKYTREDSVAPNGYTLHVDNICTDPNLLARYNQLNTGTRYVPCGGNKCSSYDLPNLPAGQVFGTARSTEIRVAIVDTGAFLDPRSCNELWQIRPNSPYPCP